MPLASAMLPGKPSRHTAALLLPGMGLALPTGQALHDVLLASPHARKWAKSAFHPDKLPPNSDPRLTAQATELFEFVNQFDTT